MRSYRVLLALLIVSCSLFSTVTEVSAFPPLPSSYFGPVQVNDADVPVGTRISAWINGVEFAWDDSKTCLGEGNPSFCYSLTVPGDDPATAQKLEGGHPGDIIEFHIGNLVAQQTGVWSSGGNIRLPLTAVDLTIPNIVVSGALDGFVSTSGLPSRPQGYTVSGVNLTAPIVITPPAGFQVSLNSANGFGASLSLDPSGGVVPATTVYVRLNSSGGRFDGVISHTSAGAPTRHLAISGLVWSFQSFLPLLLGASRR